MITKSEIISICRELRKNHTLAEKILWQYCRNKQINNKKILRQHPIFFEWNGKSKFFIADFYCSEKHLIIEIDGDIHKYQKQYDEIRTEILENLGYSVVRFKKSEILTDIRDVINRLNVLTS